MPESIGSPRKATIFSKEFAEVFEKSKEYISFKEDQISILKNGMAAITFPEEIAKIRSSIIPLLKSECEVVEHRLEKEMARDREYCGNIRLILERIRNFRLKDEPILAQEILGYNPWYPSPYEKEIETQRELWWSSLWTFCLLTCILVWPIICETGEPDKDAFNIGEILKRFGSACHNAGVFAGGDWSVEVLFRERSKNGADKLHSKPGGSREKVEKIRAAWATGKYDSRDVCAEQECAAIGMSFSTARKALRNIPKPS